MSLYFLCSMENSWVSQCESSLFNPAKLFICYFSEDLNGLVKQHIKAVVSRGFSRALSTVESDVVDLVTAGMLTLSAKLTNLEDDKLLPRLIEIWILFYDQVLPYVEGVSMPLI
jgi:hypothetical protein